jgi:D-sedoheptulose 7-phosphate isomerase
MNFKTYLKSLQAGDEGSIDKLIETITHYKYRIYVCGNGGSYSSAQHFVQDINKSTPYHAVHIGSNPAYITAVANDTDFNNIFVNEYKCLTNGLPEIHLLISTSGKSENIIKLAQEVQRKENTYIFSLTGIKDCPLFFISDYTIVTPADTIYKVESIHSVLLHYLIERLKE